MVTIDGTEISGATIDGTDVSEITVDGDTVWTAIPDSVVSRPDDDNPSTSDQTFGIAFGTSQEWPDIQVRVSNLTEPASDEEFIIEKESDGTVIDSVDVSDKGSGDVVTFSEVDLESDTEYLVYGETTNGRRRGYTGSVDFPYVSDDGNLEITAGYDGSSLRSDYAYHISEVGNINL